MALRAQPAEVPPYLADLAVRLRQAIVDNRLYANEEYGRADLTQVAREIIEAIVCVEPGTFPRLVQRAGLLFVVEEGAGPEGLDMMNVSVWNGSRWITVDEIPIPPPPLL